MTTKHCDKCTNVKLYDGEYRCMECFKKFFTTEPQEDVMNMQMAAPAIERIQELETENTQLKNVIATMKRVITSVHTPVELKDQIDSVDPGDKNSNW